MHRNKPMQALKSDYYSIDFLSLATFRLCRQARDTQRMQIT
jgi:hypothetical protein